MLQQHLDHVNQHPDCVILTRVGDFYEMYFDQVDQYAPLVGLKKAIRKTNRGNVPMAGFQHAQLERYVKMFVMDHGLKVAISEQFSTAGTDRFERRIARIYTHATLVSEGFLDALDSNYLLAIQLEDYDSTSWSAEQRSKLLQDGPHTGKIGLSWVDLSSGEFNTQSSDHSSLSSIVARINPKEIILDHYLGSVSRERVLNLLADGKYGVSYHNVQQAAPSVTGWEHMLEQPIDAKHADEFTLLELAAGNLVLDYIRDKLREAGIKLQAPMRRSEDEYMVIDKQSLRGLELKTTLRDNVFKGSLLHTIRKTTTKSGARMLAHRLVSPLMSLTKIEQRLNLVQEMHDHNDLREDIVALLGRTSDTMRLLQRFSVNKGDADDMLGLAQTINIMSEVSKALNTHSLSPTGAKGGSANGREILGDFPLRLDLESATKLAKAILLSIDEEGLSQQHNAEQESHENAGEVTEEVVSPDLVDEKEPRLADRDSKSSKSTAIANDAKVEDVWIMRRNASATLAMAHADLEKLQAQRNNLTADFQQKLKLRTVSLRWSPRDGYFCHITGKDLLAKVNLLAGAQTLKSQKGTHTFSHADWQQLGVRIDESKLKIRMEEERVFDKLRKRVVQNLMTLRRNAAVLDELDVACSSAIVAKKRGWVRPILNSTTSHHIVAGRHPTVDAGRIEQGRGFIANDCSVGDRQRIYLITGPNMAGKSTYLRQNALITILAQIGCFVPADYAEIGLVDKIFSRVGSADNLYQDQSTFMVEMLETAEILKKATPRSFVIMDEVGRGTTPEDGVAIGYACLHHLHNINKSRTLFATHFHELSDMTAEFAGLACYCTDVVESSDGAWSYEHKLKRGVNRKSHALKVARLAAMPEEAIGVASEVLNASRRLHMQANSMVQPQLAAAAGAG